MCLLCEEAGGINAEEILQIDTEMADNEIDVAKSDKSTSRKRRESIPRRRTMTSTLRRRMSLRRKGGLSLHHEGG